MLADNEYVTHNDTLGNEYGFSSFDQIEITMFNCHEVRFFVIQWIWARSL